MATLKDLGEYLDLSVTQVSRALNGHSDVNEKTRLRVQQAAKKLNYSPNIAARNLVSGRSGVIGLVSRVPVGEASDNYLDVIVGLSAQFAKHNRQFIIHIIDKNEDEIEAYRKLVNSGAIDGFVIVESIINDPRIAFLQEKSFPFVVHGRTPNENNFPYFDIDNYGVAYSLTEHLIKLGHKHIALINGLEGSCYSAARLKGYQAALAADRLPFYPHLLRSGGMYESLGVVSTVQLLTHTEIKPTAIIAGNILIARGVYKALDALKLDIPQHISVVAHDDVLPRFRASAFYPALTVTRSALENSWGPLAEYLCGSIDGMPLKNLQQVAPFEFMTRASTAAVNNTKL
ncbi:MAG: substrate-binding domain-containing protein [Alphaproteobacteria bacterium]|nr:substrate-binding domain-containing protein [Alphaproteobacteria bacterium]